MSTLNVRVNDELKQRATELFSDLGLDMSTAVNLFLRQSVECDGLPFEIKRHKPNADTLAAIKEGDEILKHPEKHTGFDNASDLFAAILSDAE